MAITAVSSLFNEFLQKSDKAAIKSKTNSKAKTEIRRKQTLIKAQQLNLLKDYIKISSPLKY